MRATEPLCTVTGRTTVVVRVSLAPGDAEGEGDGEEEDADVGIRGANGAAPPNASVVAMTPRHRAPAAMQSAGTSAVRVESRLCGAVRFTLISYAECLGAT